MHFCFWLDGLNPPSAVHSLHFAISLPPPCISITPLSPSVISSSLIMNPTGVLFIRQAGGERPASQADPATLSSLGIWHWNFNRRATQAGRSVLETRRACQSELTNRREHSKCAALLAWQSVTSVEEGREDSGRMMASGKAAVRGSRGTTPRHWAAIQVREEEGDGRPGWQEPGGKLRQCLQCLPY